MLRTNLPRDPCGAGSSTARRSSCSTRPTPGRTRSPAWAPLTDSFQIAWCATPGPDAGREAVEDVLETLADRRVRTHVVADAGLAGFAVEALAEFGHIARTLVVVGPGETPPAPGLRVLRVPGSGLSSPAVVASVLAELGWART
ncbi:hypothetical protein ACFQV2_27345 [Actinokineospora soli]|uniref:Uncharacterized protein n=1 Tax=Actinokineospora soli TaxID=1048753 RepID=A0ABW2TTG0_9PSEU